MRRESSEIKINRTFRHGVQIHFKEIYGEFTVIVSELESFGMKLIFLSIFWRKRFKGILIELAVIITAEIYLELLAFSLKQQGMTAIRAG
jgi:hypothetical protein